MLSFKVDDKEMKRQLRTLARSLNDQNIEKALAAGGFEIANAAKDEAPYFDGVLRQSIHVGGWNARPGSGPEPHEDHSDIKGNGRVGDEIQVLVGTNLVYAPIQEFGGSIDVNDGMRAVLRGKGYFLSQGTRQVHIPSSPYLRPAFRSTWRKAYEKIREVLLVFVRRALR